MSEPILGWDVGGANLKVARLDLDCGGPALVWERPFALWRYPNRLASALRETAGAFASTKLMAMTMTAELADCFATKREGVAFVLDAFHDAFPLAQSWIYGVDGCFRSTEDARQQPHVVAAANWMASATLASRTHGDALLVDVGSTTTDLIPIRHGKVAAQGRTDPERLCAGELVYTGALRTPVCAIVQSVPLGNRRCRVAAEHFAIAADVHLWLGQIGEEDYACDTPDNRGRSRSEAGARLARMVCGDSEIISDADITIIATSVASAQVRQIADGIRQVIKAMSPECIRETVLAGQGAFLAEAAARELGLLVGHLTDDYGSEAARSAPATAVAYLLAEMVEGGRLA